MFSATRNREIIVILLAHGLRVSYERILRISLLHKLHKNFRNITLGLGEALLQLVYDDDAVIPGLLRTRLFTVWY